MRTILDCAAAALLLAVLAVTAAQVTARYFLGISMPWGEELTRLLFVWLVLIGASRAPHMSISLLPDWLPPRGAWLLRAGAAVLGVLLLGILIYYAVGLVELTVHDRYTALGISVQYLYWSVIVGGGLWIVVGLAELISEPERGPPRVG